MQGPTTDEMEKSKSLAQGGIQTQDLFVTRHVLYRSDTTAAKRLGFEVEVMLAWLFIIFKETGDLNRN